MKTVQYESSAVSFGCGALLGVFAGVSYAIYQIDSMENLIVAAVVGALVCGTLAVLLKGRFWEKLSSWLEFW